MRWLITGGLMLAAALLPAAGAVPVPTQTVTAEFHFVRMIYADNGGRGGFGRGRGWWQQDYPEAELHFLPNLRRMTRLDVGEYIALDLMDDHLFEYPWLYATQTGFWDLSEPELERLREYLLRGGFLMCDDFWDEDEMYVFVETMARLFPDRQIEELHGEEAVLHVVFSIDEQIQIPGQRHVWNGQAQGLAPPRWYGIFDDNRRLMVGINYNQDVGDSWEHANDPDYPQPMTAQGYRFGINYVIYAMTH